MSALGYALNALDYPTSIGRDVVAGLSRDMIYGITGR